MCTSEEAAHSGAQKKIGFGLRKDLALDYLQPTSLSSRNENRIENIETDRTVANALIEMVNFLWASPLPRDFDFSSNFKFGNNLTRSQALPLFKAPGFSWPPNHEASLAVPEGAHQLSSAAPELSSSSQQLRSLFLQSDANKCKQM